MVLTLFLYHCNILIMNNITLEKSKFIQGILAIIVIIHHLYERYIINLGYNGTQYPALIVLYDCSYLFIPCFMFLIGYGLYKSYINKTNYTNNFIKKRILPTYSILVIIVLVLSLLSQFTSNKESIQDIIKDLLLIKTFDNNCWFIIAIILFYCIFYITFKTYNNKILAIIGITVFTIVYVSVGLMTNHGIYIMQGEIWYNAVHLFVIGVIFAYNEKSIMTFTNKHYRILLVLTLITLVILIQCVIYAEETWGYYGDFLEVEDVIQRRIKTLIIQQITGIISAYTMVLISIKTKMNNKIIIWIGNMALELYVVHYAILSMSKPEYFNIINKMNYIIFALLSVIVAFPLAYGLNKVRVKIYNRFK